MSGTQLANLAEPVRSRIGDGPLESWQTIGSQNARVFAQAASFQVPPVPSGLAEPPPAAAPGPASDLATPSSPADVNSTARPVSDGWYARRRDQAQAAIKAVPAREAQAPASPTPRRNVLLEWTRPADQPYRPSEELTGVVQRQATSLWR